ncbi:MAG: cell division protein ZapA [Spirochaetaceae bacterium]|jgi:cell division protein ZapA (FtsZ GTPase activity inhibitor)|nr:cell division protein ZapA [Spirochaetaceae bacterium]
MLKDNQPEKTDLRIEVLGTSVFIAVEEEPEYLNDLLRFYRSKITAVQKSSGLKDPLKIAILSGFVLCDELQKKRDEISDQKTSMHEVERIAATLIARVDDFLSTAGIEKSL